MKKFFDFQHWFHHLSHYVTRFSFVDVSIIFCLRKFFKQIFFVWKLFINRHFSTNDVNLLIFISFSIFCCFSFYFFIIFDIFDKFFHTRRISFFDFLTNFCVVCIKFSAILIIRRTRSIVKNNLRNFITMTFVFKKVAFFVWFIFEFQQVDHIFNRSILTNENQRVIDVLTIVNFRFFRTRVDDESRFFYFSKWFQNEKVFHNVLNQFRRDTADFRQTTVFQSFFVRFEIDSTFENFTSSIISRHFTSQFTFFDVSIFSQSNASINSKFRRVNDSKSQTQFIVFSLLRSQNSTFTFRVRFTSSAFNYFSITNFDDSKSSKIIRFTTKRNFFFVDHTIDTSSSTHFNQTEKIFRFSMIQVSSSFDVNQNLWTTIMIVVQIFSVVQNSTINSIEIAQAINDNDDMQLIVKSSKNIDYFDSDLKKIFDKNFEMMIVDRHIYYRDVFFFIDKLKNLKKSFFDSKIKKYVVECFKKTTQKWVFSELIELKKNFLRDVFVKQWCNTLIKRFKKRVVIALKNLQNERYIFVDVRNDKTSRVYVQNVLRHVKTTNYFFTYHQLFNVWNNFELVLRK